MFSQYTWFFKDNFPCKAKCCRYWDEFRRINNRHTLSHFVSLKPRVLHTNKMSQIYSHRIVIFLHGCALNRYLKGVLVLWLPPTFPKNVNCGSEWPLEVIIIAVLICQPTRQSDTSLCWKHYHMNTKRQLELLHYQKLTLASDNNFKIIFMGVNCLGPCHARPRLYATGKMCLTLDLDKIMPRTCL